MEIASNRPAWLLTFQMQFPSTFFFLPSLFHSCGHIGRTPIKPRGKCNFRTKLLAPPRSAAFNLRVNFEKEQFSTRTSAPKCGGKLGRVRAVRGRFSELLPTSSRIWQVSWQSWSKSCSSWPVHKFHSEDVHQLAVKRSNHLRGPPLQFGGALHVLHVSGDGTSFLLAAQGFSFSSPTFN